MKTKSDIGFVWTFPLPIAHKYFEFQWQWRGHLAYGWELYLERRQKQDHAGIFFSCSMPRIFFLQCNIHDGRHWDYEKNDWVSKNKVNN